MPRLHDRHSAIAAFLAGAPLEWPDLKISADDCVELCDSQDLAPLLFYRLSCSAAKEGWPADLALRLAGTARAAAAHELLRGHEIRAIVQALADGGLTPILVKGTPLAYAVYDAPSLRPREDTDLLIAPTEVEAARRVFSAHGYAPAVHCHDLFSQIEMQKTDSFGVCHVFDVHWKISTQPVFESVLTHAEMLSRAVAVPALGLGARAAGRVDALMLACIHSVMHHRNDARLLWAYDAHLLACEMSAADFSSFATLAIRKGVAAICAYQLQAVRALFGTELPARLLATLVDDGRDEPSAEYLASDRAWRHELAASMRATPSWSRRTRMLRDVLLPPPDYMLGAYGLRGKPLGRWLLPALYVHRNVRGAVRVLTGKK